MTRGKAAIYARRHGKQGDLSLNFQISSAEAAAKRIGLDQPLIFIDTADGAPLRIGSLYARTDLAQLREAGERGEFDSVLTASAAIRWHWRKSGLGRMTTGYSSSSSLRSSITCGSAPAPSGCPGHLFGLFQMMHELEES